MSHRMMHLALSLVLTLCSLFNSSFCDVKETSEWNIYPVSSREISPVHHHIEAGNKAFAHKLFKTLLMEHPRKNIVFSPLSISASLAMISLGTRSTTLTNLLEGLGFDLEVIRTWDIHQGFQGVVQMLSQLKREGHLRHRDVLFIDGNRKITSMFLWDTEDMYDVRTHMIDFRDGEKTKKQIDHFVAEKMHKRTKEFTTSLNPHTFLFLVNYVFFKGIWEMAFHTDLTYKEDFFVDEHTTVQVDMMWKTERMIYSRSEELFATMVKIPYVGNMSIVLMLPDVGKPDSTLKDMIVQKATLLKSSDMRLVHLIMPKFKISSKIDLKHLLPKMGIRHVFTTAADFSGITEEDFPALFEAVHEATMEVSQEGKMHVPKETIPLHTHTAAPVVVKFNRPFFLLVEDWMTQRALLMGKVFNPTAE